MLTLSAPLVPPPQAPERDVAWQAAAERVLNCWLRETGHNVAGESITLVDGRSISVAVVHRSAIGHHRFGEITERTSQGRHRPITPQDLCRCLTRDVALRQTKTAVDPLTDALMGEIENSVRKTAQFLRHARQRAAADAPAPGSTLPRSTDANDLLRECEQALVFGHAMHPTPKASEGFTDDDLARYAPEMGAAFTLHALSLDGAPLPCHPWQASHLQRDPSMDALVRSGRLRWLGPQGPEVWPTSSVRTVYAPQTNRFIKLALQIRITHYWRLNPTEHVQRSLAVSAALDRIPAAETLTVLRDRSIDQIALPSALAEQLNTLHRDGPPRHLPPPVVVAALLEPCPVGGPSRLLRLVRESGADAADWLSRYLDICLAPVLELFVEHGVSLEAHAQNALLCVQDGWPAHLLVRDLEGGALVDGTPACAGLASDSPARYDAETAWRRLCYYFFVNHLGNLVAALAADTATPERALWAVVSDAMQRLACRGGAWATACNRLLQAPTLPAKANLTSRLLDLGERPRYVQIPNPLRSVNP